MQNRRIKFLYANYETLKISKYFQRIDLVVNTKIFLFHGMEDFSTLAINKTCGNKNAQHWKVH